MGRKTDEKQKLFERRCWELYEKRKSFAQIAKELNSTPEMVQAVLEASQRRMKRFIAALRGRDVKDH